MDATHYTNETLNMYPCLKVRAVPTRSFTLEVIEAVNTHDRAAFGYGAYTLVRFTDAPAMFAVLVVDTTSSDGFRCIGRTEVV